MINPKKTIICKRCGKKVGVITLKWRFKIKVFTIGFIVVFITQFVSEWIVNWFLFGGVDRLLK